MDDLNENIVVQITQELDCGCNCYFNLETNEIIAIPNFLQFSDEDEFKEAFKEPLN